MDVKEILTPTIFAKALSEGKSVETIVKGYCSRSRGYQILKEYKETFPELFPKPPVITKETLQRYLDTHTLKETAKYFQLSINTLKKRMRELEVEKKNYKEIITEVALKEGIKAGLNDSELANLFGCSVHTVMKQRYQYRLFRKKVGGPNENKDATLPHPFFCTT